MLDDYYYSIGVYREASTTDDWGNTDVAGNWTLNGSINGFIQVRSGNYITNNQAHIPLTSHMLYTDVGVDVKNNDRVKYDGDYYRVEFIQPTMGISGIGDHQEIGITYLGDI